MATFSVRFRIDGEEREMDEEGCSFADSVGFDADAATMKFDKLFDDSESQPQPAMASSCRRVALLKTVEDIRHELWRDAFTRIHDTDFDVRLNTFEQHPDLSVLGSKFDGVIKEIPKNLLQPVRVAGDRSSTGIHNSLQVNAFGLRRGPYGID